MLREKYYLGLDIGTESVGYAVSDEEYQLLKFKGEPMWGVHLFEAAKQNDERRGFRTARRRLDRRQQRVKLVQELFAKEIAKVDPKFYQRMKESFLWREDAEERFVLFNDENYNDRDYHEQYPTIHHLICELIQDKTPHDVRLVYLACAWLVAHRGHFLNEVSKEHISDIIDIHTVYGSFLEFFNENVPWECEPDAFGQILRKKMGITAKYREFCELLFHAPKAPKNTREDDDEAEFYSTEGMLKLLCGGKVSPKDLFGNAEYADLDSLMLDQGDEELVPSLTVMKEEEAELILRLKALYDWALLADVRADKEYISEAKVEVYEQHKRDLQLLKRMIRKYAPDQYALVFRADHPSNYAAYVKKASKTATQEEFCKFLRKIVSAIPSERIEACDQEAMESIKNAIAQNSLCPKQVNGDNRVIPHQIYWLELKQLLEQTSTYLPFLNETDADGFVTKEKLLSIFEFRVPYFVGPLNRASKEFSWFERKAEGKLYPWNFDRLVDYEKSEQAFINRMTNSCSYLPFADVLPKQSLLHEKFQVLNEINSLTVNGVRIPVEVKQRLYTELFMVRKKVTKKAIKEFLQSNGLYTREKLETLAGIDDTVKSSLSMHLAFRNLLQSGKLSEEDVERIIERATYTENRFRLRKWIDREYRFLSEADRRYLSNIKCRDFARLSRELLCETYGDPDEETGEIISIIERMWNENVNLMELLSDRYTYKRQIQQWSEEYYREHPRSIEERMNEMYLSNSVKRSIIRTFAIVRDVVKATGNAPEKIFIEMARGGKPEEKGKRTKSRYQQLKELYEKCDLEDARRMSEMLEALGEEGEQKLQGDRLFLYYLQLGRSMYSNQRIELSHLSDNKYYEVDHIYPRSKVKDDSVWNNKVLVLSEENDAKKNRYPIQSEIRKEMSGWWKLLREHNFITEEKYKRLVRFTPFDENEEWGFINRQIVETRQSTKAVATLLKEQYPDAEIVYVKAGLVSEFRQEFDMLKSRVVNDLHHAKDAYLNIVVGNVYNERFTREWFLEHRDEYNLKVDTLFGHPVKLHDGRVIWHGGTSIAQVRRIVQNKNAVHMTRYAFCRKGGFFDIQPVKAKNGLIPLKKGLPTEKYGGYNKSTASFFVPVKYMRGKKTEITIMPVELLIAERFLSDEAFAGQYAKETISNMTGKRVSDITFPLGMRKMKINTVLDLDGMKMVLNGKTSGGKELIVSLYEPLVVGYGWETYFKRLERFAEKKKEHPNMVYVEEYDKISLEQNIQLFDMLTEKLACRVYRNRPANPLATFQNGRAKFVKLDIYEQSKCLLQMVSVFGRKAGGCDLQSIGGKANAAATQISSSVSNWKKNYTAVFIVDQSPSGLLEKRSENLLSLL